jgi:hypothetical protein
MAQSRESQTSSVISKSSQILRALAASAVLVAALGWFIIHEWIVRRDEATEGRQAALRDQGTQRVIDALVSSADAVADWRAKVCPAGAFSHILTVDLQNTLIRGDNRPLLFSGDLTDVSDRDGEPVITISEYLCRDAKLRVEAIADAEQVNLVMSHRSDREAYFAMAVRVESVQKQQLNPAPVNTDGDDTLSPPDEFVVRGSSVQVLSTGWDGMLLDFHNRVHSQR